MSKYVIALQVLSWLFVAYIISLVFKFLVSLKKMKRLSYYSLKIENKKQKGLILNVIRSLSKILSSLVIFNGLARTYDKYIYEDGKFYIGKEPLEVYKKANEIIERIKLEAAK